MQLAAFTPLSRGLLMRHNPPPSYELCPRRFALALTSVVAAVHLALRVEDATPVAGIEALLRVEIEEHLYLTALLARLEYLQLARRLQLAGKWADERRRGAPWAHELARAQVERRSVQRAHDGIVLDGALVERRADVRAHVGGGEDAAALVGRDQEVLARAEARLQRARLQVGGLAHGRPHILGRVVFRVVGKGRAARHADGRARRRRRRRRRYQRGLQRLALLRLLQTQPDARCVYVAPKPEIASQRYAEWSAKFASFGGKAGGVAVVELTGANLAPVSAAHHVMCRFGADHTVLAERGGSSSTVLCAAPDLGLTAAAAAKAEALLQAATDGDAARVRELIEAGADIEKPNNNGRTPLMNASSNGHETCARALIENGARKDVKTKRGETALQIAKRNGHTHIVASMLE